MNAITVSKYSNYIKQIFDAEELLHNIKIIGEVFGVSFSRQIAYFSLKDENAAITCVCFYPNMFTQINEGDLVVITGSPNYYTKSGKLSFNVINIEKSGQGVLFQKFIEMKNRLQNEGLFDEKNKKNIPTDIKRIGVITSKEGAVIRDIINVSSRRNPMVDIVLFPTKVQGIGAEDEIAYAIEKFSDYDNIDVIIVARGGGSLEDLWAYNTEKVAKAIFNCNKPIISAVGHETDFTIADFVADLRAPTPSAAAELLTENVLEKKQNLNNLMIRLKNTIDIYHNSLLSNLRSSVLLFLNSCKNLISNNEIKITKKISDFMQQLDFYINAKIYDFGITENSLKKLSPIDWLKKGYVRIEQNGKMIDKVKEIVLSSNVEINFYDGKLVASPIKKEIKK